MKIRISTALLFSTLGHLVACSSGEAIGTLDQAVSMSPSAPPPSMPLPPDEPSPLHGHCFRLALSGPRYLDAYTAGNGDVVTRGFQDNDTQHWCFTQLPGADVFAIQHRSFAGQFLDAYASSNDRKAVLRDRQEDGTQDWHLVYDGPVNRLEQVYTGRHLEGKQAAAEDYRVVTRPPWETAWGQRWLVSPP